MHTIIVIRIALAFLAHQASTHSDPATLTTSVYGSHGANIGQPTVSHVVPDSEASERIVQSEASEHAGGSRKSQIHAMYRDAMR